jgi:protein-tyrosine phosphatase
LSLHDRVHRQFRDDPLNYPWRGTAAHGDTPFDTTLVTKMDEDLYLGGCVPDVLLPADVEYVVSLYPWEQFRARPDQVRGILSLALYDDVDQEPELFLLAATAIDAFRAKGPTLVHCQAGLNRSATALAVHLIRDEGMTAEGALALMRERRSPAVVCNAGFEAWLMGYAAA